MILLLVWYRVVLAWVAIVETQVLLLRAIETVTSHSSHCLLIIGSSLLLLESLVVLLRMVTGWSLPLLRWVRRRWRKRRRRRSLPTLHGWDLLWT